MKKLLPLLFLTILTGISSADRLQQQPAWMQFAGMTPVRNSFPVTTVTSGASRKVRFKTYAKAEGRR
ncbi:MAG: hypothetical protein M0024_01315 [Nitrospiraceae bacterium]|nr:hypothetical protein [Nitrospiraceae bacterium]